GACRGRPQSWSPSGLLLGGNRLDLGEPAGDPGRRLLMEMTGDLVTGPGGAKARHYLHAIGRPGQPASRMEGTAGGAPGRGRRLPLDRIGGLVLGFYPEQARHQSRRVGVASRVENLLDGAR